jgi:hypothetical protein
MTPEELRALDPDAAIERTAEYLGVPKSIVWNQWTQESARGKSLRGVEVPGRGQAKGHFQAMDDVRAMFERKHPEVKNLNLDTFGDALYLYARHMEENLKRTKGDVPEAVVGYFAGWDPKQRGKHAEEYLQRVVYGQGPTDKGFIAAETPPAPKPRTVFRGMTPEPKSTKAPVAPATAALNVAAAPVAPPTPEGFLEQTKAADALLSQDPESLGYKTLDRILGNAPEVDGPTDYYETNQGVLEEDLRTEHEVESLREMRYAGKTAILLRKQELIERRSADKALGELPLLSVIAGSISASRNSPRDMALALGTVGVSAAAGATLRAVRAGQAAGVARQSSLLGRAAVAISPAQRLADANRPLAAFGAAIGESVATDTAVVILDDTLGRTHKTASDYLMEVGTSAVLGSALELATLPATLRDARKSGLLERTAVDADEMRAQGLHTESDAATGLTDDTALDSPPVATDADALSVNRAAQPEPIGRRVGGDTGLERIIRDADAADEADLLEVEPQARSSRATDETASREPKTRGEVILTNYRRDIFSDDPTLRDRSEPGDLELAEMLQHAEAGDSAAFVKARNAYRRAHDLRSDDGKKFGATMVTRGIDAINERLKPGAILLSVDGAGPLRVTYNVGGDNAFHSDHWRTVVRDGKEVNLPVETFASGTAREALTAVLENPYINESRIDLTGPIRHMLEKTDASILDGVQFTTRDMGDTKEAGVFYQGQNRAAVGVGRSALPGKQMTFREQIEGVTDSYEAEAVAHEFAHAITSYTLQAVEDVRSGKYIALGKANPNIPQHWHDLYDGVVALQKAFVEAIPKHPYYKTREGGQKLRYAALNPHEFMSQAMSNVETRTVLQTMPATLSGGGRFQNMWQQFKALITKYLTRGMQGTALEEATILFDRLIEARNKIQPVGHDGTALPTAKDYPSWVAGAISGQKSTDLQKSPELSQYLDVSLVAPSLSSVTSAQARKFSDQINAAATAHLKANPIDQRKLDVLAALAPERIGALSAGLQLAKSKTPVLQRMAQILTETTTGAAGRNSTVAIRRDTLVRNLASDSLQKYTELADSWATDQGIGLRDRLFTGIARQRFDKEVTLYQRRVLEIGGGERKPTAHPAVMAAADTMASLYQRAADAERAAGTVGSATLPKSSAGYAPQRIDPGKLAAASVDELRKIRGTLAEFWQVNNEWDADFSVALADLYIDRARARALGEDSYGAKTVDAQGIGDIRKAVKGLLDAGAVTKEQAQAAMQRLETNKKRGLKSHRERLEIPMFAQISPGKQLVDFFVTDQISLAHRHIQSTSGEVALTEMGIPGASGLERMRLAAVNSTPAPSRADMRAFDQVVGELFGRAPDDAKYSEFAQSVRLMTSVLKLGGVVFNQLAETSNVIHTFGMRAALQQVTTLPAKLLEVHQLKSGKLPGHNLLTSFEADGAEIGMGDYRMNFPLRATDELLREYTETPGMVNTLLKAGAMAQHKLSFMRGVHAAQHRGVAELIVKKSARFLKEWDGVSEVPKRLQDMGFTQELAAAAKQQLPKMAVFEGNRLVSFDVQQLGNQAAIEAYTQTVHRGTRQIIQGTFIGERNAWVHNDYMGILTQFRTFSITAMEKQWARQRMTYDNQALGYAYLAGLVVAQATVALPIYAARVYSQALLQDEDKRAAYIDARMNGPALARGLMNYSSSSGATGDLMEYALMFGGKSAGIEGARGAGQADVVGTMIPAAGVVNQSARAIGGAVEGALDDKDDNVHIDRVLKTLPFSSLWYVVPFINAAK